jgi:hypothetical protein
VSILSTGRLESIKRSILGVKKRGITRSQTKRSHIIPERTLCLCSELATSIQRALLQGKLSILPSDKLTQFSHLCISDDDNQRKLKENWNYGRPYPNPQSIAFRFLTTIVQLLNWSRVFGDFSNGPDEL